MNARPWQLGIIAVAVVAIGVSAYYMLAHRGPNLPKSQMLLDVSTGQLYDWNMSRYHGVVLPARDPENGEIRLVPVMRDPQHNWTLTTNGKTMLGAITSKFVAVDPKSGEVLQTSKDVKTYVPPKSR